MTMKLARDIVFWTAFVGAALIVAAFVLGAVAP